MSNEVIDQARAVLQKHAEMDRENEADGEPRRTRSWIYRALLLALLPLLTAADGVRFNDIPSMEELQARIEDSHAALAAFVEACR